MKFNATLKAFIAYSFIYSLLNQTYRLILLNINKNLYARIVIGGTLLVPLLMSPNYPYKGCL